MCSSHIRCTCCRARVDISLRPKLKQCGFSDEILSLDMETDLHSDENLQARLETLEGANRGSRMTRR